MNKDNLPKIKNDICPKKDYSNLTTQFYCLDEDPFMLKEVETTVKDIREREENVIADEIIRVSSTINTSFSLNKDKVVEIVSKAIPKKVDIFYSSTRQSITHSCPCCGSEVGFRYLNSEKIPRYCCNCGQKLDWSDIVDD